MKAHACAPEPEAALDLAVDKIGHQVARIKDKRVSRSHPRRRNGHGDGTDGDGAVDDARRRPSSTTTTRRRPHRARPSASPPSRWIPGEAALQLQLLGHDFYLFTNSETGRAAVLYRRHDGDLGLIETTG